MKDSVVITTIRPEGTIGIAHVPGDGVDLALAQAFGAVATRLTPWEALHVASVLVEAAFDEAYRQHDAVEEAEKSLRQAEADPKVIEALGERVAMLETEAREALVILAQAHTHAKVANNRDAMGQIERAMLRLRGTP